MNNFLHALMLSWATIASLPMALQEQKIDALRAAPTHIRIEHVPVRSQQSADCGLHAAYNTKQLYDYLIKNSSAATTNQAKEACAGEFNIASWKKSLKKQFGYDTNLYDEHVYWTALNLALSHQDTVTVISNTVDPVLVVSQTKCFIEAIEKIRYNDTAAHAFILGTMSHEGSRAGHWIAVAVHRDQNHLTYYAADSMHGDCTALVTCLRSWIEEKSLDEIAHNCIAWA